jgi:septal ring factor EnvC (AmiA/AmiB activator)
MDLVTVLTTVASCAAIIWKLCGVDKTFDRMEKNFSHIDQKFDALGKELKQLREDSHVRHEKLVADVGALRADMNKDIGSLRTEMVVLRDELHQEIGAVRDDLHKEMTSSKSELGQKIDSVADRVSKIEGEMSSVRGMLSSLVASLIGSKIGRDPQTPKLKSIYTPEDDHAKRA